MRMYLAKYVLIGVVLIFVFLLVVGYVLYMFTPIAVKSISPAPGSKDQKIYSSIEVLFTKPLSNANTKSVSINTNPSVKGESSWSDNNQKYTFTPPDGFASLTKYSATINYPGGSKTWSFTTININNSPEDQGTAQSKSDERAATNLQTFYQNYPWYSKMPISNNSFFVGYDNQSGNFIVYLYPLKNSSITIDKQVASLKTKVLQNLSQLGINTNQYKIEWHTSPK